MCEKERELCALSVTRCSDTRYVTRCSDTRCSLEDLLKMTDECVRKRGGSVP